MSIEWFRDLVISVLGIVAIGVLALLAVMSFSLYRRMKAIQNSMRNTLVEIQSFVSASSEMVKPLIQMTVLIQGIVQGIELVIRLLQNKERREQQ